MNKPDNKEEQMKTRFIQTFIVAEKAAIVTPLIAAYSLLAGLTTLAQSDAIPTLNDIASRVAKATAPLHPHRVVVRQTVEQTATNAPPGLTRPGQSQKNQSTYTLHFTPQKGFRTEVAPKATGTNAWPAMTSNVPTARLSINIPSFLKEIQAWPTNNVTKDVLDGKQVHKVLASNRDVTAVFWADAKNNCIRKVILDVQGKRFAESSFVTDSIKSKVGSWTRLRRGTPPMPRMFRWTMAITISQRSEKTMRRDMFYETPDFQRTADCGIACCSI
ncbi:MAG: hypothetical protein KIS67_16235 [Verrucomicrobiae bacterium]|nr:hypothetical protein [Verrucomicrobiae bacterium]